VLSRTNAQLTPFADALTRTGVAVRRSATASGSPLQLTVRSASSLGSASRLRAWAHDVLDGIDQPPHASDEPATGSAVDLGEAPPERRVATAVLEFLREQPLGDGAAFRAWVATTNPFDDATTDGVDLLTFHAAKGREWHTVFVTGVETSLVPHKSAHTNAERAEEARLLYVACTRATDQLTLTRASRRGGYARSPSPFVADLDVGEPEPAPPPFRGRPRPPRDHLLEALHAWRDEAARRANILPTQVCSDRDLRSIARVRPRTVDDLAAATTFGPITAERLAPELLDLLRHTEPTVTEPTVTGPVA
jgi:DNA helicase-2/ATP-dependent DNA helicase PcrA